MEPNALVPAHMRHSAGLVFDPEAFDLSVQRSEARRAALHSFAARVRRIVGAVIRGAGRVARTELSR